MGNAPGNIENAIRRADIVRASGRSDNLRVFSIALMGVFFVVLMIGLVAGVTMYRSIAEAHSRANDLEMQTGIVASAVHAGDVHDALGRGKGPEGDALVLTDTMGGDVYETRLYQYGGFLVQEHALAGHAYNPGNANKLLPVDTFEFDLDGGLATIRIDDRSFVLYVRSSQDGTSAEEGTSPALEASSNENGTESIEDERTFGGIAGGAA